MLRKDHISENYRKRVEELLNDQTDLDLSHQLSQEEQEIMWEEISIGMDIGDVWEEISADLDLMQPVSSDLSPVVKSLAVLLIITIGMIPVKKETENVNRDHANIIMHNQQIENRTGEAIKKPPVDPENVWYTIDDPVEAMTGASVTSTEAIPVVSVTSEPDEPYRLNCLYEFPIDKARIPSEIDYDGLGTIHGNSIRVRDRISVGVIGSYKNTWLLNNVTFECFRDESLYTSVLVFCYDAGLSVNYSLKNNWSLQGDGFLFSNTGHEYLQFTEGQYLRKNTALKYSTIAFSVKYSFSGKESVRDGFAVNAMAGGYLSILHHATSETNDDPDIIEAQYSTVDYGVRLGSEIELRLSDHLSIAPGILLSFGIPNIYKGNGNISDNFRKTHNGSLGFQLALYYAL